MIEVKEIAENEFEISWDDNDPMESMLNDWTEQDFINLIREEYQNRINKNKK